MTRRQSSARRESLTVHTASTSGNTMLRGPRSKESKAVWAGRIAFVTCLLSAVTLVAVLTYYFTRQSENELHSSQQQAQRDQYEYIAAHSLEAARAITGRIRQTTKTMASIASHAFPNANVWPFVTVPGYEEISNQLIQAVQPSSLATSAAAMGGMAFCPLVTSDVLSSFEDFAYDYFENTRTPPFPNGTAVSSFGKGVWNFDPMRGSHPDNKYLAAQENEAETNNRTSTVTNYNSPDQVLCPLLQLNTGSSDTTELLRNIHFDEVLGQAIDRVMDCELARRETDEFRDCGTMTEMISPSLVRLLSDAPLAQTPSVFLLQPILPASNRTTLTGLIVSHISWDTLLQNLFSNFEDGIDCVIESDTQAYTYTIVQGMPKFVGDGDLHEMEYDGFRRQIALTREDYVVNQWSANYTLSIYPAVDYFEPNSTSTTSMIATTITVCILLFVVVLFLLYDFLVLRAFHAQTKLLDAKRSFVRFVSHEVRTPLNSVSMGLTLMQEEIAKSLGFRSVDDLSNNDAQAVTDPHATSCTSTALSFFRLSQEIHANVLRSVGVLNDLLNYDKIEMGTLTLELTIIKIQELVETTASEFKLAAAQKKLNFNVDFDQLDHVLASVQASTSFAVPAQSRDCRIVGDDIRLRQVIRNVLSNAIKFTPEHGDIRVCASWVRPTPKEAPSMCKFTLSNGDEVAAPRCGWLRLSIQDSGAGMTKDQVARVFGDGIQFNANALQGGNGTGLGMHISKGIMEQHGGTLEVTSAGLGCGTTFTIMIPMHHWDVGTEELVETTRGESTVSLDSLPRRMQFEATPLRVLVVDDAAMNRKLLTRLLRNHGHQCDEAENGELAVCLVKQAMDDSNPYDTVLLDNEMPVMDGPTAAERMRAMGSDVFIVGITGNLLPDDVANFRNCGANSVLPKPFHLSDLEDLWVEYGIHKNGTDFNDFQ